MANPDKKGFERPWERFVRRFEPMYGEGHSLFVCHAVFPLVLTPDLLYQTWFNFRTYADKNGGVEFMDAIAVSDLLLSGLLKEVGHERYEVLPGLRAFLLEKLKADVRFGHDRLQLLAAFLQKYADTRQTSDEDMGLRQVWSWTAAATTNPERAAQLLAAQLRDAFNDNQRAKQMQVSLLLDQIGADNDSLSELKTLAEGVLDPETAANLPGFLISDLPSEEDLFSMPLPPQLNGKVTRAGLPLNQARDLAWRLAEARNSTRIDLSNFDLESVPEELQELTHLEDIDLKNNRLTELPPWFSLFIRLKRLRLSHNWLSESPYSEIGLPALEELTINNNRIHHFPPSLFSCPSLRKLLMTSNGLEDLPEGISRISTLEHLDVGSNSIRTLPDDLGYLQGLRMLYVNDNLLKGIPESLARAVNLEVLQAHNNQLTALPPALLNLGSNLKPNDHSNPWQRGLRLEGNRFPGEYSEGFWQSSPAALINRLSELTPLPEEGITGTTVFITTYTPERNDSGDEKLGELHEEIEALRVWLEPLDAQNIKLSTAEQISLGALTSSFEEAAKQQFPVAVWHHGSFVDGLGALYETMGKASPDPFQWITTQKELRLVFLNTCDSLTDSERLFKSGIPAVIGIDGQIPNNAAVEFAKEFYQELAAGKTLEAAFDRTESYMLAWGEGSGQHRAINSQSYSPEWNYRHVLLATEEMKGWRLVKSEEDSWIIQRSESGLLLNKGAKDGVMQGLLLGTNGFELTGEVAKVEEEISLVVWDNFYSSEEKISIFPFSMPNRRLSYGFFGAESTGWESQLSSYFSSRLQFVGQQSQRTDEVDLMIEFDGSGWWVYPPGKAGKDVWKMPFDPEKDPKQTANWLTFLARYYVLQGLKNPFNGWEPNLEVILETNEKELFGGAISQGISFPGGIEQFVSLEIRTEGKDAKWASWAAMEGEGRIRALHAEAIALNGADTLRLSSPLQVSQTEGLLLLLTETPMSPLILAQDPVNGNPAAKTSFLDSDFVPLKPDWQLIYLPFPPKPDLA